MDRHAVYVADDNHWAEFFQQWPWQQLEVRAAGIVLSVEQLFVSFSGKFFGLLLTVLLEKEQQGQRHNSHSLCNSGTRRGTK
jgi:hypothetical protein